MPNDSKDRNVDFIKRSELLNGMKRYFGIESQEDDNEFQKYIRRYTNLQREDKSTRD
ncbi:MAG TPA: hypothetical protein VE130_05100 [Nitrososphaeraceae archaeon]|jgi:hypothetical protein|nr:hypothetical protein [Nitrososphaeraceae archaeon]